ncbi:MAG: GreA/GreB family elongation factor [Verrucomicrobiota bacterium]
MNEEAIDAIIEKEPSLKRRRDKLEELQPGAYCVHRSWGFGQIKDYDATSNKLIIDFEEKPGHAMDPAFCVDKLDVLPNDHLLVRKRTEPDAIQQLIKKEPVELVVEILRSAPEQSATNMEVERVIRPLIGELKHKKWWTATKKLLVRDPRIAVPSKKTDPYVLREDPIKPEEEILEEFNRTKNPKARILLAERLFRLSEDKTELKEDLPEILETLTTSIQEARILNDADRLHGVWVRNDLARDLHEDVEVLEPTSASILDATEDLSELIVDLPAEYYKRFLDLIKRTYPDRWETIAEDLLMRSSGKFTAECVNFFLEQGEEERVANCFQRWLDEQSIKGPVLHWILKNRQSRKYQRLVEPMMTPRLLNATFYAVDDEALHMTGSRRIPLAEQISDDRELIPDLLATASAETARDLAQMLMMNQGFEDLTKKSLLARFIRQFPQIQSLVAGAAEPEREEETLVVSQASFDRFKAEYEDLVANKIPENKEAIAVAREHGDLRENAEYKMARQDQDTLLARKSRLEVDLARARITDFADAPADKAGIGTVVDVVEGSTGTPRTYAILGAWDSDPERNIVSYKTPLGQALLGKSAGDSVTTKIAGEEETWTIKGTHRWVDVREKLDMQLQTAEPTPA